MRKILLAFLSCVVLLFSCHNNAVPIRRNTEPPINSVVHATVAIIQPRTESSGESAQPYCSGFFVSRRMIVSALHCFQGMRLVRFRGVVLQIPTVEDPTGEVVQFVRYGDINMLSRHFEHDVLNEARVVSVDRNNDIALLLIEPGTDPTDDYIRIQHRAPEITQHVYLVGHPQEVVWTVVDGIVSRVLTNTSGRPMIIQATIPLTGGFSGGPMVNEDGEVLGLASAYLGDMHHISIFVASNQILGLMLEYEIMHLDINN